MNELALVQTQITQADRVSPMVMKIEKHFNAWFTCQEISKSSEKHNCTN
jgi:hypothetical protein